MSGHGAETKSPGELAKLSIAALGIGYSHPRVRFKRHPLASLGVVAIGQGALGYLAGAAAAVPYG